MTGYFGRANRGIPQDVHGQIAQDERIDVATRLPVRVKEFDHSKQTVTLEVLYKPRFGDKVVDFPDLMEVPAQQPRAGGFALTFPVKKGDYGFVEFGARDLDNWWEKGEPSEAASQRYHSFSDGVFVPGASPSNNVMQNYDNENLFVGTDDHKNGLRVTSEGTVALEGKGESLFAILSELLDALSQDTLVINYGSSAGSGHQLQFKAKYAELLGRINTMKYR